MGETNDMAASLKIVARSPVNLQRVVQQINKAQKTEEDVISALPAMTDEEVIETRWTARIWFRCFWKVEIACDAEIWDRQERGLERSGKADVEEKGILAAVHKRAKQIGCGASTIRANARLYRRFEALLSTEQGLDDKAFYQAAMEAEDPEAKLAEWAERKKQNRFFKPADAWREVKKRTEQSRPDETAVIQTKEVKKFLSDYRASLKRLRKKVPASAIFLFELVDKHLADVQWQAKRTVQGDCQLIMKCIVDTGGANDDDIYNWLTERGYVMRNPQLDKRLQLMIDNKMIIDENAGEEGKLEQSRGKQQSWYVPYYTKRKRYQPEVEYGEEEDHF